MKNRIKVTSVKHKVINGIIAREGGYVDDPRDSGGATMYGITHDTARFYGYQGEMKNLPRELAARIYEDMYWKPLRLDDIQMSSPSIAEELADTAVNMGVARAGEFLQRSLNALNNGGEHYSDVPVDGSVGMKTITAFLAYMKRRGKEGEIVLHRMLNCLQGAFYVTLAERRQKDEAFLYGWFLHRVT